MVLEQGPRLGGRLGGRVRGDLVPQQIRPLFRLLHRVQVLRIRQV